MSALQLIYDDQQGKVGIDSKKPILNKIDFRYLLNVLLASKFDLKPYMVAEGGVKGHSVHLKNDRILIIGLEKDLEMGKAITTEERTILSWYSEILKTLFIDGHCGRIIPELLWFDKKYEDWHFERLNLLRDAIIHSNWESFDKETTLEKRVDFAVDYFPMKVDTYINAHMYADEFLPLRERGYYLHKRNLIMTKK